MRMYVKLTLFQLHAILLWKTISLIETQVLLKLSKSGEAPEVERTKKIIKTKGELLDPETRDFKAYSSQSRIKQIKRSNECTSIVGNLPLSSVYFDQSNSLLC